MRTMTLTLALVFSAAFVAGSAFSQPKANKKPSAERVQGMKAAVADIEKGMLKQILAYPFAPPAFIVEYRDLAKKECGIDIDLIRDGTPEYGGYNDVMQMEIEHRFGRGIMNDLARKAEVEHKNKKNK